MQAAARLAPACTFQLPAQWHITELWHSEQWRSSQTGRLLATHAALLLTYPRGSSATKAGLLRQTVRPSQCLSGQLISAQSKPPAVLPCCRAAAQASCQIRPCLNQQASMKIWQQAGANLQSCRMPPAPAEAGSARPAVPVRHQSRNEGGKQRLVAGRPTQRPPQQRMRESLRPAGRKVPLLAAAACSVMHRLQTAGHCVPLLH